MKKLFLIASLALIPTAVFSQSKPADTDAIVQLRLNSYHETPSLSELQKIAPNARAVVERVATTTEGIGQRRAIVILARTKDAEARKLLVGLLERPTTSELIKHELVSVLVINYEMIDLATLWLNSDDVQRRLTAIDALGKIDTDAATALLRAHVDFSESKVERNASTQALRRLR